jgi:hypothetical protein
LVKICRKRKLHPNLKKHEKSSQKRKKRLQASYTVVKIGTAVGIEIKGVLKEINAANAASAENVAKEVIVETLKRIIEVKTFPAKTKKSTITLISDCII